MKAQIFDCLASQHMAYNNDYSTVIMLEFMIIWCHPRQIQNR